MGKTVEFFLDVGSPTTYLAWTQLPRIAAESGAAIAWRPMLLGGVFKATGNASPVTVAAKGRWMMQDMPRFAARYGVPFMMNPHFPVNTLTLMRGAVAVQRQQPDRLAHYLDAVFHALWRDGRDLGYAEVLADTLTRAGFDAASFAAWVGEPEVKAALVANTEEAVARGVFGAPTFFVGGCMFFGQDRLDFVREALSAL